MARRATINIAVACGTLAAAVPAAAAPVPVAIWAMDNDFGTTMTDSSGNGNDGVMYDVGTSGGGYIFNGSTSKVVVPDSPTLNPGTQPFSYTVQVQTDRIPPSGTDYDLLRKGLAATEGGEFKVEIVLSNGKGVAFCHVADSTGKAASVTGFTNVADNQLHTIKCTKSANYLILQVDSRTPKKTKKKLGKVDNTSELMVGAKSSTGTDVDNDWYTGVFRSATISVGS